MKIASILVCWLLSFSLFGQGKFASTLWKPLIGKSCKSETEFPLLKGFTSQGGTLLSDVEDEEKKSVVVFAKGSTVIVLFELMTNNTITIVDLVEINNMLKTQELKVGTCRDGENDSVGLVALVSQSKEERWKAVKTWYFNLDKIRVEEWPSTRVTCLGIEGDD
jgi:hypothetical protein